MGKGGGGAGLLAVRRKARFVGWGLLLACGWAGRLKVSGLVVDVWCRSWGEWRAFCDGISGLGLRWLSFEVGGDHDDLLLRRWLRGEGWWWGSVLAADEVDREG